MYIVCERGQSGCVNVADTPPIFRYCGSLMFRVKNVGTAYTVRRIGSYGGKNNVNMCCVSLFKC